MYDYINRNTARSQNLKLEVPFFLFHTLYWLWYLKIRYSTVQNNNQACWKCWRWCSCLALAPSWALAPANLSGCCCWLAEPLLLRSVVPPPLRYFFFLHRFCFPPPFHLAPITAAVAAANMGLLSRMMYSPSLQCSTVNLAHICTVSTWWLGELVGPTLGWPCCCFCHCCWGVSLGWLALTLGP